MTQDINKDGKEVFVYGSKDFNGKMKKLENEFTRYKSLMDKWFKDDCERKIRIGLTNENIISVEDYLYDVYTNFTSLLYKIKYDLVDNSYEKNIIKEAMENINKSLLYERFNINSFDEIDRQLKTFNTIDLKEKVPTDISGDLSVTLEE